MGGYTYTKDWLHSLAGSMDGVFVSGDPSFSKKIGITNACIVALRFAANRREIYGYFLTIQSEKNCWNKIQTEIARSEIVQKNILQLENMLNKKIPIIFFDNNHPEEFALSLDMNKYYNVNSDGLKEQFGKYNPEIIKNPGTFKHVNRSINDSFQRWTRSHLSKYLVINDFDIIIPRMSFLIELKRVKENIIDWRPYLDDKANYLSLLNICNQNNLSMLTIAYNYDNEDIALHHIDVINDDSISGIYCICQFSDIIDMNRENLDVYPYISARKRQ